MKKKEILERLREERIDTLLEEADGVRKACCGEDVFIRGIIEFSNYCVRDCVYCGLRRSNAALQRYRMTAGEVADTAHEIIKKGIKTVVLQSGDDPDYTREMVCDVITKIKKRHSEAALTLSLGERPLEDYRAFRNCGADRYLLKQETMDPRLYGALHPGQTLKERIQILGYLRKLGFQTGAGNIVGLPGQTMDDLADDILFFERFQPDMAGIGPFIPQADTPLKGLPAGTLDITLKVLALARIVTGNAHLPATTALATVAPENGQLMGLKAGANVIMPDCTPPRYGANYRIYDGKVRIYPEIVKDTVLKAERVMSFEKGDSFKKEAAAGV
ncbi:MAG: [FeFe] hydrogenase H-cluster radical SAM maturase HydE [Candidatus Makaraimicrobium thalassicum]|nr:MAG: [FeFe] hydrogenase H-cluster radical SAM maturase HydE [Candidatus Omnitrophota bacterium]